jgi:hypothetical protein
MLMGYGKKMRHGQGNGWLARVGDFIDFSFCRIKEEQE